MKAGETTVLKFLEGKNQYLIPIFQRTYSWGFKQCQQLWNDTINTAENHLGHGHFTGSIVYVQHGLLVPGNPPQMLIIDGQQRLTTVMLLLAALSNHIRESCKDSIITSGKINDYYLFNTHEKGDMRYKLILTKTDKATLNSLLDGREFPDHPSNKIIDNYQFFKEKIEHSGLTPDHIFRGIERLNIVGIALDGNSDNPQLIFESLNSTGIDLSQADLIRNYVLLGLEKEEQDQLYNDYWHPMEQYLASVRDYNLLDMFIRDYVTIKIGRIPTIKEIYPEFKAYVENQNIGIREIIADVYKFSKYYARMALLKEDDKEIREAVDDLNKLQTYVSYPFFLQVYEDYFNIKITKSEFIEILRLVESYVFRRYTCGLPPASLSWIFASLYREIDQEHYLDSLKQELLSKESHKRFPEDEEFTSELLVKDIYSGKNCRYILRKLENYNHKEKIVDSDYTIDHIMPQNKNLSEEWQRELGPNWKEIQSKYLHTIGNLTLTGHNFEFKDYPFSYKRDREVGGYKKSPLVLNHMLGNQDHWNEEAIKARARELVNLSLKVWAKPDVKQFEKLSDKDDTEVKGDRVEHKPDNHDAIEKKKIVETTEPSCKYELQSNEESNILKVFNSENDLHAARVLINRIFDSIDYQRAKHVITVSYGDSGVISIAIGPLVILKFIKYTDGLRAAFIIDRELLKGSIIKPSYVEPLSEKHVGPRNMGLIWIPWSHKTVLPQGFVNAWYQGIKYAYVRFKDEQPTHLEKEHIPAIANALIVSR